MNDGRALSETELEEIQRNVFAGFYDDQEINKLFETIVIQRRVLHELFSLFHRESPLRRVYIADPVRHSALVYLKELARMEDVP